MRVKMRLLFVLYEVINRIIIKASKKLERLEEQCSMWEHEKAMATGVEYTEINMLVQMEKFAT